MEIKEFINKLNNKQLVKLCSSQKTINEEIYSKTLTVILENANSEQIKALLNSYTIELDIILTDNIKKECEKDKTLLIMALSKIQVPLNDEDQTWLTEQLKKVEKIVDYPYDLILFLSKCNNKKWRPKEELINELERLLEKYSYKIVAVKPEIQYNLTIEQIESLINERKYAVFLNIYDVLDLNYWFDKIKDIIYLDRTIWIEKFNSYRGENKYFMLNRWDVPFNYLYQYNQKYLKYFAEKNPFYHFSPDYIKDYVNKKLKPETTTEFNIYNMPSDLKIFTLESIKQVYKDYILKEEMEWI